MPDEIDPRLRDFALGPGPKPNFETISRVGARRRRVRRLVPVATAAVLALIIAGGAFAVLQGRSPQLEPIGPLPLPTPSVSLEFAVDPGLANGRSTFGLGAVDDGMRVDGATFETTVCPDGVECPIAITLEVTNSRSTPFGGGIIVTVYRNGIELTGTGAGASIPPGETASVRIVLDPATTDIAPDDGTAGVYTWNWFLE
jgi:hypothetical protein